MLIQQVRPAQRRAPAKPGLPGPASTVDMGLLQKSHKPRQGKKTRLSRSGLLCGAGRPQSQGVAH